MNGSLTNLRRALLAFTVVGSLGFGVTQAFATPDVAARAGSCQRTGYVYRPMDGCEECPRGGYCNGTSETCVCINLPTFP